jgi:hypothetical protein
MEPAGEMVAPAAAIAGPSQVIDNPRQADLPRLRAAEALEART